MTWLELSVPLGLGVVSSLHCAGMCGPLVLAYSMGLGNRGSLTPHLLYNAGRISTYAVLGALAGAAGGGVTTLGQMAGVERQLAVLFGALMIVAGMYLSGMLRSSRLVQVGAPGLLSRIAGRLVRTTSPTARFLLGAAMGVLPCGLVYAALFKALTTSSAVDGALTMTAFGAGTSGMLLAIGLASGTLARRLAPYSTPLMSLSITALGAFMVWKGLSMPVVPGSCH